MPRDNSLKSATISGRPTIVDMLSRVSSTTCMKSTYAVAQSATMCYLHRGNKYYCGLSHKLQNTKFALSTRTISKSSFRTSSLSNYISGPTMQNLISKFPQIYYNLIIFPLPCMYIQNSVLYVLYTFVIPQADALRGSSNHRS